MYCGSIESRKSNQCVHFIINVKFRWHTVWISPLKCSNRLFRIWYHADNAIRMHIQNFDFAVSLLFFSGQLDITICYCVICFSLNLICENANDQPPNKMSGKTNRTHQLRNDNMLHQIYERIGFDWIQNAQYNRFGAE